MTSSLSQNIYQDLKGIIKINLSHCDKLFNKNDKKYYSPLIR